MGLRWMSRNRNRRGDGLEVTRNGSEGDSREGE